MPAFSSSSLIHFSTVSGASRVSAARTSPFWLLPTHPMRPACPLQVRPELAEFNGTVLHRENFLNLVRAARYCSIFVESISAFSKME